MVFKNLNFVCNIFLCVRCRPWKSVKKSENVEGYIGDKPLEEILKVIFLRRLPSFYEKLPIRRTK